MAPYAAKGVGWRLAVSISAQPSPAKAMEAGECEKSRQIPGRMGMEVAKLGISAATSMPGTLLVPREGFLARRAKQSLRD